MKTFEDIEIAYEMIEVPFDYSDADKVKRVLGFLLSRVKALETREWESLRLASALAERVPHERACNLLAVGAEDRNCNCGVEAIRKSVMALRGEKAANV